jgi:hypothetical protein
LDCPLSFGDIRYSQAGVRAFMTSNRGIAAVLQQHLDIPTEGREQPRVLNTRTRAVPNTLRRPHDSRRFVGGDDIRHRRCPIERFLAPVEPGNLLLIGYKDEIPIMSALDY